MPRQRKYETNAERQAAYRMRIINPRQDKSMAGSIPPMPSIASMPGHPRWQGMLRQAHTLLGCAIGEMEQYFDQRSERWQDSEQAEAFTDLVESMQNALSALEEVPY